MNTVLNKRLNSILKNPFTQYLRSLGFKKSKYNYLRNLGELAWIINVQKSQFNDKEMTQFTINGGIYVPEVFSIYSNTENISKPQIEHCSCSVRIGMLTEFRKDIWWKLKQSDSIKNDFKIAEDTQEKVEKYLIPFLGKFKNLFDIADFLESELDYQRNQYFPISKAQRLAFAGIIYSKLGEIEKSNQALSFAVEASKKSPIEDIVKNLKKRF